MEISRLIFLTACNALWITAVWNMFLPGQVFGFIGDWMAGDAKAVPPKKGWAPDWMTKPLFECPRCQASIHGTFWWFLFDMGPWYLLPFYVVCLSGLMVWVTVLILSKDS